jgi:hypothetical protein
MASGAQCTAGDETLIQLQTSEAILCRSAFGNWVELLVSRSQKKLSKTAGSPVKS